MPPAMTSLEVMEFVSHAWNHRNDSTQLTAV